MPRKVLKFTQCWPTAPGPIPPQPDATCWVDLTQVRWTLDVELWGKIYALVKLWAGGTIYLDYPAEKIVALVEEYYDAAEKGA